MRHERLTPVKENRELGDDSVERRAKAPRDSFAQLLELRCVLAEQLVGIWPCHFGGRVMIRRGEESAAARSGQSTASLP